MYLANIETSGAKNALTLLAQQGSFTILSNKSYLNWIALMWEHHPLKATLQ